MASVSYLIYCPKCGSEDVAHHRVSEEPVRVSMDSYPKCPPPPAGHRPDRFRMECQGCGHAREYES